MSGKQVLASVIVIVLATAVLPPAAAFAVNQRRVTRAQRDAAWMAGRLRGADFGTELVLAGPGRLPVAASPEAAAWLTTPRRELSEFLGLVPARRRAGEATGAEPRGPDLGTDPWGNLYLASRRLVLSAGPNGMVETALGAAAPAGDDVGSGIQ